jgi:hypothetical protein
MRKPLSATYRLIARSSKRSLVMEAHMMRVIAAIVTASLTAIVIPPATVLAHKLRPPRLNKRRRRVSHSLI